jgi:hypothetical protein
MKKVIINFRKKKIDISFGRWDPKLNYYDLKRTDGDNEYEVKPPRHCFFYHKYEWGEKEVYIEFLRFHLSISILDNDSAKSQIGRKKDS